MECMRGQLCVACLVTFQSGPEVWSERCVAQLAGVSCGRVGVVGVVSRNHGCGWRRGLDVE